MNKKLFTLLTSAALMAGMAPAVFAETMDFTLKKSSEEAPEGKKVYDVIIRADKGISGIQWNFKSNGDLGTNAEYKAKDTSTNGFHPIKDAVDELFADNGSLTYAPENYKKPGFEDKYTIEDNYQVAGLAMGTDVGDVSDGLKIGTLTVGEAKDGETWVDVDVKRAKATYTEPGVGGVKYDWKVVTDAEDSSIPDSSIADSSIVSSSDVSSSDVSSSDVSSAVSSSEASSSQASSSEASSQASSNNNNGASSNNNGGNNNSQGGNNNGSPDTGVASTAVVALAAASAALVVVSKKRK